jgi:glycosyltransferase involved in cell wall biosynthesis
VNIWREIVEDEAGLVENDDDEGACALLSRWMALDDAARNRMRANASRCFATRFDVRHTAARLTEAFEAFV